MEKPAQRLLSPTHKAPSGSYCKKKAEIVDSIAAKYAELDEPRPETRETDLYWKKKPPKKKVKKK